MTYVSGVRWSGIQSEPDHVFQPYDANAPEEVARREAYLASNVGKARTAIAKACRATRELDACLEDVGAALSRGDGTEIRKAEDCAETLMRLRLLVGDLEAYCRLHVAEAA